MRKLYLKLNDIYTLSAGTSAANAITNELNKCHLFDGTKTFTYKGESLTYPNLIGASQTNPNGLALQNYWLSHWGEQRIGFPVKDFSSTEITRITTFKIIPLIRDFMNTTAPKYDRLVKTLCYTYDPVSNYDMTEDRTITPGTDTFARKIDKAGQDTFVNAPHVNAEKQGNNFNSIESEDYLKVSSIDTDGKNIKTETKDETTSTEPDTEGYGTSHYTTTYDDSSNTRLAAVDKTTGKLNVKTSTGTDGNKIEEQLTPSAGSSTHRGEEFTDTTSHTNTTESLNRKGNIGVTTSQQMIESERELADFNVVRMFFEELNHYIMLQIWN